MAAFATIADYEKRAAVTLAEPRRSQVEALLDDISAMIRARVPAGYEPDPDVAKMVTVSVARRAMANPGGYRQRTIGQYSETLGEDGGLYLTDAELDLLLGDQEDPDADAAYSVTLAEQSTRGWRPDPCRPSEWRGLRRPW